MIEHINQKRFTCLSWSIFLISLTIVILAWGQHINWQLGSLTLYQWFPLFGLIAWVGMATHYYLGAVRLSAVQLVKPKYFKQVTAYTVLAALLLHPGLLAYAQWNAGQGLPPDSFVSYVGDTLRLAVMLGSMSLVLFLSYEILERLQHNTTIKRMWRLISISQSLAMVLIWVHAYRLGSIATADWFQPLWVIYGLLLIPCFYIIHSFEFKK